MYYADMSVYLHYVTIRIHCTEIYCGLRVGMNESRTHVCFVIMFRMHFRVGWHETYLNVCSDVQIRMLNCLRSVCVLLGGGEGLMMRSDSYVAKTAQVRSCVAVSTLIN